MSVTMIPVGIIMASDVSISWMLVDGCIYYGSFDIALLEFFNFMLPGGGLMLPGGGLIAYTTFLRTG